MKSTRSLIGLVGVMSLMLFLHANVVDAASVAITRATVSYEGSNQVVPVDVSNIDNDAVLVSFVAAGATYSDLVLVDSVTTNQPQSFTSHQYGINGTDPGSATNAITDNRLDSGIANVYTNAVFKFASAPTSLSDLFFLFEWRYATGDTDDSIQLVDGATNDIGAAVPMANLAQLGGRAEVTLTNWNEVAIGVAELNGVAIPLSDFVTAGQLSNVAGFRITDSGLNPADIDPLIAGIASPMPADLEVIATDKYLNTTSKSSYTKSFTAGESDKLIVTASSESPNGTITSITYNGDALTLVPGSEGSSNFGIWYLDNPYTGGAANILVTCSGTFTALGMGIVSIRGSDPGYKDVAVSTTGSVNLNVSQDNSFVVANIGMNYGGGTSNPSPDSPLIKLWSGKLSSAHGAAGYENEVPGGAHTYSFSGGLKDPVTSAVAFVPPPKGTVVSIR